MFTATDSSRNIVVQNEREKGGMIGAPIENMYSGRTFLTAQFLLLSNDSKESKIYITDYEIFENATGRQSDTKWKEFLVEEPDGILN